MKRNVIQFTLFTMVMLALTISSCKDDVDGGDGTGGGGTGGGGGGTGTVDEDYLPRELGNTWDYSDGSTVDIIGSEDVGSLKYWEITNFGPISGISLSIAEDLTVSSIKVAKDDGDYKVTATLDVIEIIGYEGAANPISYTILKDDVEEGTTWTGELQYVYNYTPTLPLLPEISTPPISVPYTFSIVEKGMTLTTAAGTFTDVIHVNQQFDNLIGGLISTDIFYAEGVGVVRYQTTDGVTSSTDLTSYDLN